MVVESWLNSCPYSRPLLAGIGRPPQISTCWCELFTAEVDPERTVKQPK